MGFPPVRLWGIHCKARLWTLSVLCICVHLYAQRFSTCAARSGFWLRQFRRQLTYGPDSRLSISPGLAVISSSSDCIPEARETSPQIQHEGEQGGIYIYEFYISIRRRDLIPFFG